MPSVSTVPDIFNITHLNGDTLYIEVQTAEGEVDGLQWDAQVRLDRTDMVVQAIFVITEPALPGDPAYLMLPAAEVQRLIGGNDKFEGVWDCQVSDGGSDPVITLVMGTLAITQDVTRLT